MAKKQETDPRTWILKLIRDTKGPTTNGKLTVTTPEFRAMYPCGKERAREILGRMMEDGSIRPAMVPRENRWGTVMKVAGYEIVDDDAA